VTFGTLWLLVVEQLKAGAFLFGEFAHPGHHEVVFRREAIEETALLECGDRLCHAGIDRLGPGRWLSCSEAVALAGMASRSMS
jgi:hypothetical protein